MQQRFFKNWAIFESKKNYQVEQKIELLPNFCNVKYFVKILMPKIFVRKL